MNAAEQAIGVEQATKIAAMVNLFQAQFPDARSDLKPWANDPDTRKLVDPDSIDIGFHLPGWSRRFQCRSILMQIRFYQDFEAEDPETKDPETKDPETKKTETKDPETKKTGTPGTKGSGASPGKFKKTKPNPRRVIGIEAVGFTHMGEQWHLSTIEHWQFMGEALPTEEIQDKLRLICRQIFELCNGHPRH